MSNITVMSHNITKCAPTKLFHITGAVSLLYQLRSNRTKSTETLRSQSLRNNHYAAPCQTLLKHPRRHNRRFYRGL